jgi:acyl carrier protein
MDEIHKPSDSECQTPSEKQILNLHFDSIVQLTLYWKIEDQYNIQSGK